MTQKMQGHAEELVKTGSLKELEDFCFRKKTDDFADLTIIAYECNRPEIYNFLLKRGFKPDCIREIIRDGKISFLRECYLKDYTYRYDVNNTYKHISIAIELKQFYVAKWIIEKSQIQLNGISDIIIQTGNIDFIDWVHKRGLKYELFAGDAADHVVNCGESKMETLKWLVDNGYKLTYKGASSASARGLIEIVDFFLYNGCYPRGDITRSARQGRRKKMYKHLQSFWKIFDDSEHGFYFDSDGDTYSVWNKDSDDDS